MTDDELVEGILVGRTHFLQRAQVAAVIAELRRREGSGAESLRVQLATVTAERDEARAKVAELKQLGMEALAEFTEGTATARSEGWRAGRDDSLKLAEDARDHWMAETNAAKGNGTRYTRPQERCIAAGRIAVLLGRLTETKGKEP